MLWMETYFLYCSVRLGVMVVSLLSFIPLFISSVILLVKGLIVLSSIVKVFNEDEHFRNNFVINMFTNSVENDSNNMKVLIQLYLFAHMIATVLAFYGSLKLKKYFLIPIIFFELCRVIFCLTFHILIMTIAKHHLNLGIFITATLAGGFFILFLGYNWATCVALYQIINLINSERYKAIYGDDPFKPLIPKTINSAINENVRVLITPPVDDIDEQKSRNAYKKNIGILQPQAIISVLPVNNLENNTNSYKNNLKWKQSHWPTTTLRTPPTAESYTTATQSRYERNNNYEENYNNWQWSELGPAVAVKNINSSNYIISKWKY